MKRLFVSLSLLAALVAAATFAPDAPAQGPPPGAAPAPTAAAKPTGRVAVFNVAKVMRDYKKWQHFANVMNQKRVVASGDLGKLRNEIADMQKRMQIEPVAKQDEIAKAAVVKQREFEDKEKGYRKALDEESAAYLRNLYSEIQACVKAIVEANGFDLVMAYPDAITEEERSSPLYFDLKLRPQAAMPFYVAPSADMTDALIEILNRSFPAPAPVAGAAPAPGAVTPAAGTAPPK